MEKLPLSTIMLDPSMIGKVDPVSKEIKEREFDGENDKQREHDLSKQMHKKSKKRDNSLIKSVHKGQLNREKIRQSNIESLKLKRQQRKEMESENEDVETYSDKQTVFNYVDDGVFRK